MFIPDTLLFHKRSLIRPMKPKYYIRFNVPKVNFEYTITVRLLTSDNESISENEEISYFYESEKFDIEVKSDSIHFKYLKNGEIESTQVTINSKDNFGNITPVYNGITPCSIELNPYFSSYTIQTDSISETINISEESSLIQCFSERTTDSVYIVVNNPRKIPFIYNIYKKNSQQASGYTDSLDIHKKTSSKQNYFVSIRYLCSQVKGKFQNTLIDSLYFITQNYLPRSKSELTFWLQIQESQLKGVDLTHFH